MRALDSTTMHGGYVQSGSLATPHPPLANRVPSPQLEMLSTFPQIIDRRAIISADDRSNGGVAQSAIILESVSKKREGETPAIKPALGDINRQSESQPYPRPHGTGLTKNMRKARHYSISRASGDDRTSRMRLPSKASAA